MRLKPDNYANDGGVTREPLPAPADLSDAALATTGLSDLSYSMTEHLKAYREVIAVPGQPDIASAVSHLEGASVAALRLADWLVGQKEHEAASAAPQAASAPISLADLRKMHDVLENGVCDVCGGVVSDNPAR